MARDDVVEALDPLEPSAIGIDDGQLVLGLQGLDDGRPDLARSDDEDLQSSLPRRLPC